MNIIFEKRKVEGMVNNVQSTPAEMHALKWIINTLKRLTNSICIYKFIYTCTYIHTKYVCMYIRIYIYTYMHTYIHIYIHTYIHTYIHNVKLKEWLTMFTPLCLRCKHSGVVGL